MDAGDELGELKVVAGGRHGDVSDVEMEIEVRIFDPEGALINSMCNPFSIPCRTP